MSVRFRLWLAAMACAALLLAGFGVIASVIGGSLAPGPSGPSGGLPVLAASGALVLIAFAPLAWLLARLAYAPVRDVTKTARSILTTGELDRRCFYPGPRDDVGRLVVVVNELLVRYDAALGGLRRLRSAPTGCACPRDAAAPDPVDLVLELQPEPARHGQQPTA